MCTSTATRNGFVLTAFLAATTTVTRIAAMRIKAGQNHTANLEEDKANDAFSFIFVSDLEAEYRGHTWWDVKDVMLEIADLHKGKRKEFFSGKYTNVPIKPILVIHGGDSYDNEYGKNKARNDDLASKLMSEYGIPFITTDGNHDLKAGNFVKNTFKRSKEIDSSFTWKPSNGGIMATFEGLQIATFLWTTPFLGSGRPSQEQIDSMSDELDLGKPTVVVNHAPGHSNDALNKWVKTLPHGSDVFSGHWHSYAEKKLDGHHTAWTAPYPYRWEGFYYGVPSTRRAMEMLAVLVSPTQGVLNVKKISTVQRSRTWRDGNLCGLGTTCNWCINGYAYWYSKALTACGTEPKWGDGTVCGAGTTCKACKNAYSYWYSKAITACGTEPKWGDGTLCGAGTTCNRCKNGYSWWWWKGFTACGQEPR